MSFQRIIIEHEAAPADRDTNNADRANRFAACIRLYDAMFDGATDGDEDKYNAAGILADLIHFCDARSIDFADVERIARDHYNEERA